MGTVYRYTAPPQRASVWPEFYKRIQANRLFRTLLNVTTGDESEMARDRAQRMLDNARQIPCLQDMVTSFTDQVTGTELQTVPPSRVEKEDYFTPAMGLPTAKATPLALRYHVNRFLTLKTFQAVRDAATVPTTSKWVRTVLSSNEGEAVQDLKFMDTSTSE
jgi:hypothetical protein